MDVEWSFTKGRHTPTTLHSEIGSRSGANDVCSQSSLHSTRSAVDQERSRSFSRDLFLFFPDGNMTCARTWKYPVECVDPRCYGKVLVAAAGRAIPSQPLTEYRMAQNYKNLGAVVDRLLYDMYKNLGCFILILRMIKLLLHGFDAW
ncbi:hypothetical protein ZEAMMB73_Zm00001d051686 [Zea mays]|uniref:Uncharacterized protein n=1 Tax=Zea mays TaxID=4577 RepID=A0A1D6Q9C6_MAIZE|nr:hypothetical protein ZEAMMB73_Zm00001d051686 [Zea mays]